MYNLQDYIRKQITWSKETFGPPPRYAQVIDHIAKELEEVRADPDDLEEWVDIIQLALDGAWRTGASAQEITNMMEFKFRKNLGRQWPDWRNHPEGKAMEHI